jgi:hypothetical protein
VAKRPNDVKDCLIGSVKCFTEPASPPSRFRIATVPNSSHRSLVRLTWIHSLAAAGCLVFSGCSALNKASLDPMIEGAAPLQGSDSAELYQRIRQAKTQNSIVLQVQGDSEPVRILPLPPDGRAVFVSDLLRQTGVQEKMGRMHVVVYRSSPVDFAGAKMDVRFDESGETVRPETDYHLQSGDRIKICPDPTSAMSRLFDQMLPANASRAIVGH